MLTREEIESRIQRVKQDLTYFSDKLVNADASIWYDEAVRQIDHNVKHLNALEYVLRSYDEVVE